MIAGLLVSEIRRTARDAGVVLALLAYPAMLVYGGSQSALRVQAQRVQVDAATADMEQRWAALRRDAGRSDRAWSDARSPSLVGGPSGFGVVAMRPDRLAVLSPGESARLPLVRRVSLYADPEEPPLENPLAVAGGHFDLAFVVIWLLPLAIIVAGHAAVAGDRQHETWRLIVAASASPGRVLARRLAAPTLVLVTMTVAAGVAASWGSGAPPAADETVRFITWSIGVGLYALVWAATTAVATTWSRTSSAAVLTLGLAWLGQVAVLPASIDAAAAWRFPPENRFDADLAARELERDPDARLSELLDAVYAEHPDWRPSDAEVAAARRPVPGGPASRDSRRVYVPARAVAAQTAAYRRRLADRAALTEGFVATASALSPALLLQQLGDEVAGLSAGRFAIFAARVATLETEWHGFFAPRIMQLRDLTPADLAAVPLPGPLAFGASPAPLRPALVVWAVVTLAAALAGRRRLRS